MLGVYCSRCGANWPERARVAKPVVKAGFLILGGRNFFACVIATLRLDKFTRGEGTARHYLPNSIICAALAKI